MTEPRLPTETVGTAYTSERGWELLESLSDIESRMAGSPGEERAAELIADAFRDVGVRDVEVPEFPVHGWTRGDSAVALSDGPTFTQQHEVIGLPGSPPGEVTAPLVDAGCGTVEELADLETEGAVVLVSDETPPDYPRRVHRVEKYLAAADAGAVGFVFRTTTKGCLPPTGDVSTEQSPGPIPAVGVSRELGDRLTRADEDAELTLTVECETGDATSYNVEGVVGPADGPEVLLTAHLDAHDIGSGSNDNGFGCATLTAAGELLATVADDLDTRVRLITFGAEEVGYRGAYHWVESNDLADVKCVVNVDGAGYSRTLDLFANTFDELCDVYDEAGDALGVPVQTRTTLSTHSDHWPFVQQGVPGAQARTVSPEGRGWGHTHADTLDKLDPRDLRDLAVVVTEGAVRLAADETGVDHKPSADVRDAVSDAGLEEPLRASGEWPWD